MQRREDGLSAAPGAAPTDGARGPTERSERSERFERPERADRPDRPERSDRPDRGPAPGGDRPRTGGRGRDFRSRRKVCTFCVDHVREIDYKEVGKLRRYLSDRAKIEPRRKTGTCAKHQRMLTVALKNARHMALLPYTAQHIRGA